ncbi:MAG: hypothetical protein ABIQ47_10670 [Tepidiformaceae bacterium]
MSTNHRRLDRVMPAVSFDERIDGILAAYHDDRRPDPALLATLPSSDNSRWNAVADVLNALHGSLGWYIDYVEACVVQLELRLTVVRLARQLADGFDGENQERLAKAADALTLRIVAELVARWHEVRLAEIVADHFGEQLGGRQLLHPAALAILADCRARMQTMHDELAGGALVRYEFELSEPSDAGFDHLLDLLTSNTVMA